MTAQVPCPVWAMVVTQVRNEKVLHNFNRGKTKSAEAFAAEHFITKGIVLGLTFCPVLASVHLDDQAM